MVVVFKILAISTIPACIFSAVILYAANLPPERLRPLPSSAIFQGPNLDYPLILLAVIAATAYGFHCGVNIPRPLVQNQPLSGSIADPVDAPGPSYDPASSLIEDMARSTRLIELRLDGITQLRDEYAFMLDRNRHLRAGIWNALLQDGTTTAREDYTTPALANDAAIMFSEVKEALTKEGTILDDVLRHYYHHVDRTSPRVGLLLLKSLIMPSPQLHANRSLLSSPNNTQSQSFLGTNISSGHLPSPPPYSANALGTPERGNELVNSGSGM